MTDRWEPSKGEGEEETMAMLDPTNVQDDNKNEDIHHLFHAFRAIARNRSSFAFQDVLGMDYFRADPSRFVRHGNVLSYRQENRVDDWIDSLGACLAVIDQHTAFSALAVGNRLGSSSIVLEAKRINNSNTSSGVIRVDSIVTKVGRNIAFCRAEMYDQDDGLICVGSNIIFLASQSDQSAFEQLGKKKREPHKLPPVPPTLSQAMLPYIQHHDNDPGKATFSVQSCHENENRNMHGGCQAVLMELVGKRLVEHLGATSRLDSIRVQYIHAIRSGLRVMVETKLIKELVLNGGTMRLLIHVDLIMAQADETKLDQSFTPARKIFSQGLLEFITTSTPSNNNGHGRYASKL